VVVGPVVIGAEAEIAAAYMGPYSSVSAYAGGFRDVSVPRAIRLRVAAGAKVALC
jgi:hypothetical protein